MIWVKAKLTVAQGASLRARGGVLGTRAGAETVLFLLRVLLTFRERVQLAVSLPRECIQEPLAPTSQPSRHCQYKAFQYPRHPPSQLRMGLGLAGECHRDSNGFGDSTGLVPSSWAHVVPWCWIHLFTDGTVGMLMMISSQWQKASDIQGGTWRRQLQDGAILS